MAIYDIVIGDFSGDGHDKTETFYMKVDDRIPETQLRANYIANSDLFGFNPSDFADEYEDSTLPAAMYDILIANGYQDVPDETDPTAWDSKFISDPNNERSDSGAYYLNPTLMFKIVAFYLTHQDGEDIPWQRFTIKSKNLIGWSGVNYARPGKQNTTGVGYGLFY